MNKLLSTSVPGPNGTSIEISPPPGIPSGGLSEGGGQMIYWGITIFLTTCVVLALGFIMYGAVNWIMSQGDKTKLESARKTIIFAVLGLIISFASFFVINLFGQFFGIDLLNPTP